VALDDDTVAVKVTLAPVAGFEVEAVRVVVVAVVVEVEELLELVTLLLHPEMTNTLSRPKPTIIERRAHLSCIATPH
jgi:hypothetical protein